MQSNSRRLPDHYFAESVIDETCICRNGRLERVTSSRETGSSWNFLDDDGLLRIEATTGLEANRFKDLPGEMEQKITSHEPPWDEIASHTPRSAGSLRIRYRHRTRYVQQATGSHLSHENTIGIDSETDQLITTVEFFEEDMARLMSDPPDPDPSTTLPDLPILWLDGTGAILIHEALGHAIIEESAAHVWPSWLTVTDEPHIRGLGYTPVDDAGQETEATVLTSATRPTAFRRQDFREPPSLRMTNLFVRHTRAPFDRPHRRIEVLRAQNGLYHPESDSIEIDVFARRMEGENPIGWVKATLRKSASEVAAALKGAQGSPTRYPGSICFDDGQRVAVGSWSADLLTEFP